MKKALIGLTMSMILSVFTANSQQVYKGQIQISSSEFTLTQSNQLQVTMQVAYQALELPSNESLTITPVLRTTQQSLELPAVQINGPERQRTINRQKNLAAKKTAASASSYTNAGIVLANDTKAARQFTYKVTVPYQTWMKQSSLVILTQECDCGGKTGQIFEDILTASIDLPITPAFRLESGVDARLLALVNFLQPGPEKKKQLAYSGSIPFDDFIRLSEEKQNYEIYYNLREALTKLQEQQGIDITAIKLTGYGSPSGNLHRNERDAAVRSLSLKNYLRQNRIAGKKPMEVTWVAEDWDSVTAIVSKSDMMFRDAVLDIISTVDVSKGRERILINLADGIPYKYLAENIFPRVRRMDFEIQYNRTQIDSSQGRKLLAGGSTNLTLSEFFAVANSYPTGSAEYNDALDLAARLFPESAEANINAAAVALVRGDKVRARRYLERFSTLPEAYNNMGILYMLEGNRDKAEVYLEMAQAAGVKQASQALKQLR